MQRKTTDNSHVGVEAVGLWVGTLVVGSWVGEPDGELVVGAELGALVVGLVVGELVVGLMVVGVAMSPVRGWCGRRRARHPAANGRA